jgi:hypothetical protein
LIAAKCQRIIPGRIQYTIETFARMSPVDDDLPLCVFLDTQVYRAMSFDWASPNFVSLRERVTRGSIELVTTEIIKQEIRKGIRGLLNEFTQDVRKIRHLPLFRHLEPAKVEAITSLAANTNEFEKLWAAAESFLSEIGTTILDSPASAFADLFKLYFSGSPPFGSKGKKSEFPDAANLLTLQHHAQLTGKKIYVVSGDGDWCRVCAQSPSLIHIERLSEVIDRAIRAEWRSDDLWSNKELLAFLMAKMDQLKPMLESALERDSRVNLGDGSIDMLELDDVDLLGLAATDIHRGDHEITFRGELFHSVHYSVSISIDDDEMNNVIEHQASGSADLTAKIWLDLPLNNPKEIIIHDVWYPDGLELEIPLKY